MVVQRKELDLYTNEAKWAKAKKIMNGWYIYVSWEKNVDGDQHCSNMCYTIKSMKDGQYARLLL